jgi:DNA repair protein RadC
MDDHLDHYEAFYVMALDNSNTVLNIFKASTGGITGTVADIRLIFQHLILTNATACIIAHNHPSGKCIPSTADLSLTRKIKSAGEILDIKLFDHVIVTRHSHYSFADEGVL